METVSCRNGFFGKWKENCPSDCEFFESCKYYTEAPDPRNAKRVRHSVSFEKNANRVVESSPEEKTETVPSVNFDSLAEILRYIILLDDTSVATISEIIRNPNVRQSDLSRTRNVSRQRINTSMLYICRAHPELARLFLLCVKKVTISRNRYRHRQQAIPKRVDHPSLF